MSFIGSIAFGLDVSAVSLGLGNDAGRPHAQGTLFCIIATDYTGRARVSPAMAGYAIASPTMHGRTIGAPKITIT